MKLLSWYISIGLVGLLLMFSGFITTFPEHDAAMIAGAVLIGSVAISIAILAAGKT